MTKLAPGDSVVVLEDYYAGAGVKKGDVCVVTAPICAGVLTVRGGKADLIWYFMARDEGTGWIRNAPPWWT